MQHNGNTKTESLPQEVIDYIQEQAPLIAHGNINIKKGAAGYIEVDITISKRFLPKNGKILIAKKSVALDRT